MSLGGRQLNATVLADGKVLVTGGTDVPGLSTAASDVGSRALGSRHRDVDTTESDDASSGLPFHGAAPPGRQGPIGRQRIAECGWPP